jgi:membrane-bound lytic murein transglycosylase B
VRIGGRWDAHPAVAAVRQRARQVTGTPAAVRERARNATRAPAFGIAVITPLVFAGAVGGAPGPLPGRIPALHTAIAPVAAVSPSGSDLRANPPGPAVVAMQRVRESFHVASATISAPPPPMVVNAPGTLGIPSTALAAYRNAELKMAAADPGCGVSWNLLAGIGRIESGHAAGGAVDARGTALNPIYGPALDGSVPGNEVIVQSPGGNRVTYTRAIGPMQFLPGTWARYAADGDGDGIADPQNLFDATLAAARYLCSGGRNLRDPGQVMAAILRYNNSMAYAQNVLGWAAAYATGVVPVDLPPITGAPPPLGDSHLEHPEGLGPTMALNHTGQLPMTDPFAGRIPLIDLGGQPQLTSTPQMFPWMTPPATQGPAPLTLMPGCTLICIGSQGPGPGPLPAGAGGQPPNAVPPFGQAPSPAGVPPVGQAPPPAGMPPQGPPPAGMPPAAPNTPVPGEPAPVPPA